MNAEDFIERLYARQRFTWLTATLIALCCSAFLGEMLVARTLWTIPGAKLLVLGADFGPLVQHGEYWRLVTALFLHASPLHILFNMLALWEVGQLVERLFGRTRMLIVYAGAGLCGSLASIWWHATGLSVGASGAIFGLYGALLCWLLRCRHGVPRSIFHHLRKATLIFIAFSLGAGFLMPGVDNAAHVGGLIGGCLLGAGLALPLEATSSRRDQWLAVLGMLACLGFGISLWRTAPPVAQVWENRVEHVSFVELTNEFALHDARMAHHMGVILHAVSTRQQSRQDAAHEIRTQILNESQNEITRLSSANVVATDTIPKSALLRYASLRYQSRDAMAHFLESGERQWLLAAAEYERQSQGALLDASPRNDMQPKVPQATPWQKATPGN